jgi:hypothetical protein
MSLVIGMCFALMAGVVPMALLLFPWHPEHEESPQIECLSSSGCGRIQTLEVDDWAAPVYPASSLLGGAK